MADVSKLTGYAVAGSADDALTVVKLSGYVVKDAYLVPATVSKAVVYAVLGASDTSLQVVKLSAYAVIDKASAALRPQVATIM